MLVDAYVRGTKGEAICNDSQKIKLFRGFGIGLVFGTQEFLIPSDGIATQFRSYGGAIEKLPTTLTEATQDIAQWEEATLLKDGEQNLDLHKILQTFASAQAVSSKNSQSFGNAIEIKDLESLMKRHADGTFSSPFISTSTAPEVAAVFGPAFAEISICPERVIINTEGVESEKEILIFGSIFPEEIISIDHLGWRNSQRILALGQQTSLDQEIRDAIISEKSKLVSEYYQKGQSYKPTNLIDLCLNGPQKDQDTNLTPEEIAKALKENRQKLAEVWFKVDGLRDETIWSLCSCEKLQTVFQSEECV